MSYADTVTAGALLPWKRVGELRIAGRGGALLALGLLVLAPALAGFREQAHGGRRAVGPAPLLAAAPHPAPVPSEAEVKDAYANLPLSFVENRRRFALPTFLLLEVQYEH